MDTSTSGAPERRRDRRADRSRSRALPITAGVLTVALLGYAALDTYDLVPGVLTTEPPVEIQHLPAPQAAAAGPGKAASAPAEDAPVPTAAAVASALDPLLSGKDGADGEAGVKKIGAEVRDGLTGEVLYSRDAKAARTPASVTKVLTGAATLLTLGSEHRFTTRTVYHPETRTVTLIGGGDALLGAGESDPEAVDGHAGLQTLATETAAALQKAGAAGRPVTLQVQDDRYTGPDFNKGWDKPDISAGFIAPIQSLMVHGGNLKPDAAYSPRSTRPALDAAGTFALALQKAGVELTGEAGEPVEKDGEKPTDRLAVPTVAEGVAGEGTQDLAEVASAPVSAVVEYLLVHSDNVVSEMMGREVSLGNGGDGSAADAPQAVMKVLQDEVGTGSISLSDTSGLDYDNRISPHDLTAILGAAAQSETGLAGLLPSMPVGGLNGTLAKRFETEGTRGGAGVVQAKTGTLRTVNSLAGSLLTADGRLLVFSLMADDLPPGETGKARIVFDRATTVISECGCR